MASNMSFVSGPVSNPLRTVTLGALAESQAQIYGDRTALIVPWQNKRYTYRELYLRANTVSKGLMELGLQHGDCVGIFAGNCSEYLEVFLGAAFIGCPVVVLNSNYTPVELESAVQFSECKLLCVARYPGRDRVTTPHLDKLRAGSGDVQLILFDDYEYVQRHSAGVTHFDELVTRGERSHITEVAFAQRKSLVRSCDDLNYQFTSGTTGAPKAAALSHVNLINNAIFTADVLTLTTDDVICCPPPLFHCFGLTMGFLAAFTRGCAIVYPSQQFDANLVVEAIITECCTILHGVPTMLGAEVEALAKMNRKITSVRLAIAAGAPVSSTLVERLKRHMGIKHVIIAYGMTETSPVSFASAVSDPPKLRMSTVGKVFPHTQAKIVNAEGEIVPRGIRGEICTSGYALQRGYLKNEAKTLEAMRADDDGTVWMHTGDEGTIDAEGYCRVTGRIKDLIIRGGENIAPAEIEDRLLSHDSIEEVAVVGAKHARLGEQVVAFVRQSERASRPSHAEIVSWVQQTLARHKSPEHVFWIGDTGVGDDFPKTATGKHQKHVLRDIAVALIPAASTRARL